LRKKFEYCSPILTIQKNLKMFMQRGKYNSKKRHISIMYWALRRYQLRLMLNKLIEKEGLDRDQLRLIGKVRVI